MEGFKSIYETEIGQAIVGDSLILLKNLPTASIDLVITSPPFALQRKKEYGNIDQEEYVEWLLKFTIEIKRILKDTGSFVLDLGGAYKKGRPIRSLYNYRILIRMCDEQGWKLSEEFFWYNPAKLPSPIEWVNKRKIRAKDAVNTLWWLSKSDFPKADINNVLTPYSERMKKLIKEKAKFYTPQKRPSGHNISDNFWKQNGGSIPPNLLQIPNTDSNSFYLRCCKLLGVKGHPARFPYKLPEFFIKFLSDPGDTVLDIFAGSNTTGWIAEKLNRKWLSFELDHTYSSQSIVRFLENSADKEIKEIYDKVKRNPTAEYKIKNRPKYLFDKNEIQSIQSTAKAQLL